MPLDATGATLITLRRLLLGLLLFGLVGTAAELVLMGHDEDAWQLIPLVVIAMAVIAVGALLWGQAGVRPGSDRGQTRVRPGSDRGQTSRARSSTVRFFRVSMLLLILSGVLGAVLHYRANMEFKLETDPSLNGWALFSSVIQAKAPPALAPGNMALLGLLGLACVFRIERASPSATHDHNRSVS
jgi:hypothetical protein